MTLQHCVVMLSFRRAALGAAVLPLYASGAELNVIEYMICMPWRAAITSAAARCFIRDYLVQTEAVFDPLSSPPA
jgi:hypothetical protein